MQLPEIVSQINAMVWGLGTQLFLVGTGAYLTVRTGFRPWRYLGRAMRSIFAPGSRKKTAGGVSPLASLMTTLAATLGTGNLAGVSTALVCGGPGALVWMLLAALVGMSTKFAEVTLGIKYRELREDGTTAGGAMYYLAKGLKQKWLGVLFSVLVIPYAFVISAVVDTNSIALALEERWSVPTLATGIVLAALTAVIIFGGLKRIGHVSAVLAPFMGGLYILTGIVIILMNIPAVPAAIATIFQSAFNPAAFTGGAVGSIFVCMRYGIARGIYSNEAGLGTAAMVHSGAQVDHPIEQGLWGAVEVFLDTALVCSVTGLTIVLSGLSDTGLDGSVLTMRAFDKLLPGNVGGIICLAALVLFGFTCLISFYTYAERAAEYLFGSGSKLVIKLVWIVMIVVGSQTTLGFAWDLADTINGLMIIPNLIGLLLLSNEVVKLKKDYFRQVGIGK